MKTREEIDREFDREFDDELRGLLVESFLRSQPGPPAAVASAEDRLRVRLNGNLMYDQWVRGKSLTKRIKEFFHSHYTPKTNGVPLPARSA